MSTGSFIFFEIPYASCILKSATNYLFLCFTFISLVRKVCEILCTIFMETLHASQRRFGPIYVLSFGTQTDCLVLKQIQNRIQNGFQDRRKSRS